VEQACSHGFGDGLPIRPAAMGYGRWNRRIVQPDDDVTGVYVFALGSFRQGTGIADKRNRLSFNPHQELGL
jgi:hypothetical protein